jgi:hypothetical protein
MDCPRCAKPMTRGSVGAHLMGVHGIRGGVSGKPRGKVKKKASTALVPVPRPAVNGQPRFKLARDFVVLEDDNGGTWLAEKIR